MRTLWNLIVLTFGLALLPFVLIVILCRIVLAPLRLVSALFSSSGHSYGAPRRSGGTRHYMVTRNGRISSYFINRGS